MAVATVAAIGAEAAIRGYAVAGVTVLPAGDPIAVRAAWQSLDPDVAVVVLTAQAARVLGDAVADPARMVAVLPDTSPP
ncbi:hypothetical protein [Dactylosporangium sp. NPDC049140]|uniref:hypothetical protein n=1 Tax=Dactylosporangium sp. NPDC049140 TaxID=3155647 RepID=UPI003411CED3